MNTIYLSIATWYMGFVAVQEDYQHLMNRERDDRSLDTGVDMIDRNGILIPAAWQNDD